MTSATVNFEGPHSTGKTGKMATTKNTGKTQVVNSLIQKVNDIAIFVVKISILIRSWIPLLSQFCVCNSHKSRKSFPFRQKKTQGKQGI